MFPGERSPEKLSSIIMNKVGCRKFFLYFFLVILIAVLFVLLVTRPLICLVAYGTEDDHRTSFKTYDKSSMNIIYVVTEGLSPSSSTFARLLLGKDYPLPLDDGFAGITKTLSRSSGIPDAAAGSTALACGLLGYNGGVGVILDSDNSSPLNIPDGVHDPEPCASIFEASISLNYTAGIVTTGSLTQGSAPSFFAHMTSSVYEEKIAAQFLQRSNSIDLIFGGGRSKFNQRLDRRDLISEMKSAGYNYFDSFNEDDLKDARLPLLGLFADDHLDYAIDRINGGIEGQASLSEMVQVALDKLHAVDGRFFLLVDARNIAGSAHNHDATAHYYEIMELQDTVETIRNFVTKKDFNTVVVVATDHNVGGLSIGSDDHSQDEEDADIPRSTWSPKELFKQTRSAEFIVNSIITSVDGVKFNITEDVVRQAFALAGVEDLRAFEIDHVRNGFSNSDEAVALLYVGDVLSWRGQVSWSTLGNVNSDSFFYNFGYRPTDLFGVLSAVDIPRILAHDLGLWSRMNSLTSSLTKQSDDLPPYLPPKI